MLNRLIRRPWQHAVDLVLALQHMGAPLVFLTVIFFVGAVGYSIVLDVGAIDGMYQSAITLSTVGFMEVKPFNDAAKIFTIFLVLAGVGAVFYVITMLAASVVEGEIRTNYRRRLLMRKIEEMSGHFVICGYGRVGSEVAQMFKSRGHPYVVVDNSEEKVELALEHDHPSMLGNADQDTVLDEAGVKNARGLIAAATSDAINTYIVLLARGMNKELHIVARSRSPSAEKRLELAGANRVISPHSIGARRMALTALQPMMADFMDTLATGRHGDLFIAEFEVEPESEMAESTLVQAFGGKTGFTVMAIRRNDGELELAPRGGTVLHAGDIVIGAATNEHNVPGLK